MRHKGAHKQVVSFRWGSAVDVFHTGTVALAVFKLKSYLFRVYPESMATGTLHALGIWWHLNVLRGHGTHNNTLYSDLSCLNRPRWQPAQTESESQHHCPSPGLSSSSSLSALICKLWGVITPTLGGFLYQLRGKAHIKSNKVAGTSELTKCLLLINCKFRVNRALP